MIWLSRRRLIAGISGAFVALSDTPTASSSERPRRVDMAVSPRDVQSVGCRITHLSYDDFSGDDDTPPCTSTTAHFVEGRSRSSGHGLGGDRGYVGNLSHSVHDFASKDAAREFYCGEVADIESSNDLTLSTSKVSEQEIYGEAEESVQDGGLEDDFLLRFRIRRLGSLVNSVHLVTNEGYSGLGDRLMELVIERERRWGRSSR